MAIYHLSIKIISRGKGKSAVAAAAYRSGEKIANSYDGLTHDYTRKGGISHTEILLPGHAPREYADRSTLWNAVERSEKNKNAQLSRDDVFYKGSISNAHQIKKNSGRSLVAEIWQPTRKDGDTLLPVSGSSFNLTHTHQNSGDGAHPQKVKPPPPTATPEGAW